MSELFFCQNMFRESSISLVLKYSHHLFSLYPRYEITFSFPLTLPSYIYNSNCFVFHTLIKVCEKPAFPLLFICKKPRICTLLCWEGSAPQAENGTVPFQPQHEAVWHRVFFLQCLHPRVWEALLENSYRHWFTSFWYLKRFLCTHPWE